MNVLIVGGSFNPPHIGHIWAAQQVFESHSMHEVWFMPNYSSKNYSSKRLVNSVHRLAMCKLLIKDFASDSSDSFYIKVSNIELQRQFKYTYQTVDYLTKNFSHINFSWVIGSDWDITKFKNHTRILEKCNVINISRNGYCDTDIKQKFEFKISSTDIRNRIRYKQKITGLVTPSVVDYIHKHKLYL